MTETRPTSLTREMKLAAGHELAAELAATGLLRDDEIESAGNDIAGAAAGPYSDGYAIARELDDRWGWDCTMRHAEALDGWSILTDAQLEAAQRAWAERTHPQPPLPVGARCRIKGGETGKITAIHNNGVAKYCIAIDGDPRAGAPNHSRRIVNFEDVEPLAAEAPAS